MAKLEIFITTISLVVVLETIAAGIPVVSRKVPPFFPGGKNRTSKDKPRPPVPQYGHPHTDLTTIEIINKYEYNAEQHEIQTKDGYILELHRIKGKNEYFHQIDKPVVLLMHGILASSSDWVLSGPDNGLAFILADAGYDVWMGNARGNIYSKKHATLNTYSQQYWDFSWHEIGIYDLPAKIDYILAKTGQEKLVYIGHSQGTTAFYVLASEHSDYNDKVRAMISLAPIAYSGRMYSPFLKYLSKFVNSIDILLKLLGVREIKPSNTIMKWATSLVCKKQSQLQSICLNLIFMICGYDQAQMDMSLLPVIMSHAPAGASVKQFIHFGQIVNTELFQHFDYGSYKNKLKYGTATPPAYNTTNIRVPIALFYSHNDWLSHPEDVQSLYTTLKNPIGKFKVIFDKFNHLDYLWAKDVKPLLYKDLLEILSSRF